MDSFDRRILQELQRDCTISVEALADRIGLSRNACWNRVKKLEQAGVIRSRVALLDADKVGLPLEVFIIVRTDSHDPHWLDRFSTAVRAMPEIQGVYRMTGDIDYLIRLRVADVKSYDAFYQRLIRKVKLSDVSASFVMEEIKDTSELAVAAT